MIPPEHATAVVAFSRQFTGSVNRQWPSGSERRFTPRNSQSERSRSTTNPEQGRNGPVGPFFVVLPKPQPTQFAAIVADVPFVDVVTTMLDESIPLTTFEYDEWGNPNEREYYDYMMTYSPYDNVSAQDYPDMLVITGLHDSQVQYWEPMKWVARLRELKTDEKRLLFSVNMEAGHGGASGRFKRHRETALIYAFLLDQIGVDE